VRLWIAIKMVLVLTVLTGILYPIAMVVLAHLLFPVQAEGSLVERDGHVVGSLLIGQNFGNDKYFHPRPSAAGDKGYDASNSGGSNSGPTNKAFIDTVRARVKTLREAEPGLGDHSIPVDLVTASGSGLDPEISPAAATLQVPRVAKARGLDENTVQDLVKAHLRRRWIGLVGEPGVNVLELNLALDALSASHQAGTTADKKGS
jgi:potassium-transporting ATPase KdpC subunit